MRFEDQVRSGIVLGGGGGGGEAERRNYTSKWALAGGLGDWELGSDHLGRSAGAGGAGRVWWLGLGPESAKKLPAVFLQSSSSGCPVPPVGPHRRPERGLIPAAVGRREGGLLEHVVREGTSLTKHTLVRVV